MAGLFLSCEIPQALIIKGKPGVYIPLGDPLKDVKDADRLENYVSNEKIREMMDNSDADTQLSLYEYLSSDYAGIQTYIVHYPIEEIQLDLEQYLNEAAEEEDDRTLSYTLPPIIANPPPGSFPAGGYYLARGIGPQPVEGGHEGEPLFLISLGDMAKLVKEVNGGPFGLELHLINSNIDFEDNVWFRIPAFGINDYIKGTPHGIDKLRFVNTPAGGFIPKKQSQGGHLNENNELEIYVKVTDPCSGIIEPEMVFEWTDAIVDTSDESFTGEYQFTNELGDFLGGGVSFKDVKGYIYVNIDKAHLTLTDNGSSIINDQLLTKKVKPIFTDPFTGVIPPQSLAVPINLTNILNSGNELGYDIRIDDMHVTSDETLKIITVDLVIVLPLEFKVNTPSSKTGYVKLELNDMFPKPGKDDLFLRDSKDDGLLSNLASMTILLKNFQNTVIGGEISILVSSGNYSGLLGFRQGGKLTLNMKDLPFPFTPEFGIVIKNDDNQSYGTLKIPRQANSNTPRKFEFNLAVEAQADLDYTIDF
jgi:hypothetical protein